MLVPSYAAHMRATGRTTADAVYFHGLGHQSYKRMFQVSFNDGKKHLVPCLFCQLVGMESEDKWGPKFTALKAIHLFDVDGLTTIVD